MKLSSCISWDNAQFDVIPFRGNFTTHARTSARIGFKAIELAIRDPQTVDIELIIRTLEQENLSLSAIGTGQAWSEDKLSFTSPDTTVRTRAIERIRAHLPLAARTGAVIIIGLIRGVVSAHTEKDHVTQENMWMYDCLRACCEYAAEHNVRIALEPINRYETSFINTVEEGLEMIEFIGVDNMGLLLDSFHMNIEEPIIEQSIRKAGTRVFHVHYADSNRMSPGKGHIDFSSIIDALRDIQYDGYLSGEHRWLPYPETAVQDAYTYMNALLQRR